MCSAFSLRSGKSTGGGGRGGALVKAIPLFVFGIAMVKGVFFKKWSLYDRGQVPSRVRAGEGVRFPSESGKLFGEAS